MMYSEFIALVTSERKPTFDEYEDIIEPVYTWHPLLDYDVYWEPKKQLAMLYDFGGLKIIEETLLPTALKIKQLDAEKQDLLLQAEMIQKDIDRIEREYKESVERTQFIDAIDTQLPDDVDEE